MKTLNFKKHEWVRFEKLCKLFNLKVETDATYKYDNLCEVPNYYLRIIKNNVVICIANLID
jgi:hypothetical protein